MSGENLAFSGQQQRVSGQGNRQPPGDPNDSTTRERKISNAITPPVTAVASETPVPPSPPNSAYPLLDKETKGALQQSESVGKPQIWVRIRPTPNMDDGILEISEDGKSLNIMVDHFREDQNAGRIVYDKSIQPEMESSGRVLTFEADGILKNSNQTDTYKEIVDGVVEKALNGTSGVIISLGPELSGKKFTMFGSMRKFQYRGIIPRALEKIFQLIESSPSQIRYGVRIGIIEIRKDHVRDLLTLSPYDLRNIGPNGPTGMLLQQIGCAEHGLGLLIRSLTIQNHLPRDEPNSRYHTIVYIDIEAEATLESGRAYSKSRLTFAKIAAVPKRAKLFVCPESQPRPQEILRHDNCIYVDPKLKPFDFNVQSTKPSSSCCRPPTGDMGEAIAIRRDLFLLEQMFVRSNELRRLNRYYNKLKRYGMQVFMKKPTHSPSQYFRQSKLAHCLQDIVSGNTEIRVILNLRLERQYMYTALEVMRFAERAKCVPFEVKSSLSVGEQFQNEMKNQKRAQIVAQFQSQLDEVEKEFTARGPELTESFVNLKLTELQTDMTTLKTTKATESKPDLGPGAEDPELETQMNEIYKNFKEIWQSNFEKDEEEESGRKKSFQDNEDGSEMKTKEGRRKAKKEKRQRSKNKDKRGANARQNSISSGQEPGDDPAQPDGGNERGSTLSMGDTTENANKIESPVPVSPGGPPGQSKDSKDLTGTDLENIKPKVSVVEVKQPQATGSNLEMISEEMESELPTKAEAWELFIKTENGTLLTSELSQKQKALQESAFEHSTVLKMLSNTLSKINNKQTELDLIQQERHLRGETYDESNNIIMVPEERNCLTELKTLHTQRDELLDKVKAMKVSILEDKKNIDLHKMNIDIAFQDYCLENFAMIYDGEEPYSAEEEMEPEKFQEALHDFTACQCRTDEEIESHFEQLKAMAKEQAKYILKQMPKRPQWIKY